MIRVNSLLENLPQSRIKASRYAVNQKEKVKELEKRASVLYLQYPAYSTSLLFIRVVWKIQFPNKIR
jgi:hypothetical protein